MGFRFLGFEGLGFGEFVCLDPTCRLMELSNYL